MTEQERIAQLRTILGEEAFRLLQSNPSHLREILAELVPQQ
jgi:hypothetical protein